MSLPAKADLLVIDSRRARFGRALLIVRERGWLLAAAGVVVLSVIFVLLGRWQFGRHEAKVLRAERIDTNYSAPVAALHDLLPEPPSALAPGDQWRPVRAVGVYDEAGTVLVRNRPLDGVYGYEVIVPLRLAGGGVLLIDRGWIPNGSTGARPDQVPAPPSGTVTVTARLRPGEPGVDRRPPPGQELRIDLARITPRIGAAVYQAYGVLAAETSRPSVAPTLLPRPDTGLGPHQAYAIQWWGFAVAAYAVFFHYLSREVLARPSTPGGDRFGRESVAGRSPARRNRRPELTDEQWEDSLHG